MKYKALFFDIDGTLYVPGEAGVRPAVLSAIRKAQAAGARCVIASGRPSSAVPDFLSEVHADGMILSNGAQVVLGGESSCRFLPEEACRDAARFLEAQGIHYALQTDSSNYFPAAWQDMIDYYHHYRIFNLTHDYDENAVFSRVLKLEFVTRTQEQRQAVLKYKTPLGAELHPDGVSMEFNDLRFSKADGVKKLLEMMDLPVESSAAFGDAVNDLTMLRSCGTGVAMGNASDEVKAAADLVCPSVREEGVARLLTQWLADGNPPS